VEKKKRPQSARQHGKEPSEPSVPSVLQDQVRSAGLIFTGTVVGHGKSSVPALVQRENLFGRAPRPQSSRRSRPGRSARKDGACGTSVPRSLRVGQRAAFLRNSWIHGHGIAVREVAHVGVLEEEQVATAIAQLTQVHLMDRLKSAQLVVDRAAHQFGRKEELRERNVAQWVAASGADLRCADQVGSNGNTSSYD
jgi:hypothetical protein